MPERLATILPKQTYMILKWKLTNNTVIRHDSKLLTLADIEILLNNIMAKS